MTTIFGKLNENNMEQFQTNLSNSEIERLALVIEEAAEVQQIACKVLRHGYGSYNPFDENKTPNRELLNKEIGQLMYAIELMIEYYDLNPKALEMHKESKRTSIQQYLHFNEAEPKYPQIINQKPQPK